MTDTFKFTVISEDYGIINIGCVTMSVLAIYESSYKDETNETQKNKVDRLLNGEKGIVCTYSNCNGTSEFSINDDTFTLSGGADGPVFGSSVEIRCPYSANKSEIDNFMKFMLNA